MKDIIQDLRTPISFSFGGIHVGPGPLYMALPVLLVLFGLFVWSLVWVYRDAQKRKKQGWLVTIFAALVFWPWSLVLWLWLRPNQTGNAGNSI